MQGHLCACVWKRVGTCALQGVPLCGCVHVHACMWAPVCGGMGAGVYMCVRGHVCMHV